MTTEQASWLKQESDSTTAEVAVASWSHQRALRERNKSLRRIYAEAGMAYGPDIGSGWGAEGGAELARRTSIALNLRTQSINAVVARMSAARQLDLCFLVDATSSMIPHIDGVKRAIQAIVDKLLGAHKNTTSVRRSVTFGVAKKVRLAFVGYRDFCDSKQFELLEFTDSVNTFHIFVNGIAAIGGGDTPEDVFGGLEKAIALGWSTDGSTRMLFHIADAPSHGREFHSAELDDTYPSGDPKGRTHVALLGQLAAKGIQYYFGKINNYTDIMVQKFKEAYNGELVLCDVNNPDQILTNVLSTTSIAITGVGPSARPHKFLGPIDKTEPNWNTLPKKSGLLFSYELPESIGQLIAGEPLKPKKAMSCTVQVAKQPFASGVERVAHYGRDVSMPDNIVDIVLKKYFDSKAGRSGGFINKPSHYEAAIQLQTIAAYLAAKFTDHVLEKVGHGHSIKFLKGQVLSYAEPDGIGVAHQRVFMSCERRYPAGYKYLRFTNNMHYSMLEATAQLNGVSLDFVKQMLAFSHWTYEATKGYLMVTDLQGVIIRDGGGGPDSSSSGSSIELTDPAIHCTDLCRFGRTNMGPAGMRAFFGAHECNEFCHKLGLNVPTEFA